MELKKYRIEIATAGLVLSGVFGYIAWSAQGRLDDGFIALLNRQVAVRHKESGAVLVTGTSQREAVEDHVNRVRRRWIQHMQRAGTDRETPPQAREPGSSREEIRAYMEGGLAGAELSAVDLSNTELNGIYLRNARLDGANLEGSQMRYARLEGTSFTGAKLDGAALAEARLAGADFHDTSCVGADFSSAGLGGAVFAGSNISGANFDNADCSGADFSGVVWSPDTSFKNAKLDQVKGLPTALLENASERNAEAPSSDPAQSAPSAPAVPRSHS